MAKASRKDARDAVRAARSAFAGWSARTPYNRGQVIYRIAEVMEGRRDQLVDQLARGRGRHGEEGRRTYVDAADRPRRLVRRLGRQVRPGARQRQPGVRPVLQPLHARAHRRRRDRRAQRCRCSALVSTVLPAITTGNTVVVVASEQYPDPGRDAGRDHGHVRPPRRRRQPAHRQPGRDRPVARHPPRRRRPRPHRRRRPRPGPVAGGRRRRGPQARPRVPARTTGSPSPASTGSQSWVEIKTVWHPIGV